MVNDITSLDDMLELLEKENLIRNTRNTLLSFFSFEELKLMEGREVLAREVTGDEYGKIIHVYKFPADEKLICIRIAWDAYTQNTYVMNGFSERCYELGFYPIGRIFLI